MKWEHCRLFVTTSNDVYLQVFRAGEAPRHVGVTGSAVGSNNDALPAQIELLGQDGWELVTILTSDAPDIRDIFTMYFKRQVAR